MSNSPALRLLSPAMGLPTFQFGLNARFRLLISYNRCIFSFSSEVFIFLLGGDAPDKKRHILIYVVDTIFLAHVNQIQNIADIGMLDCDKKNVSRKLHIFFCELDQKERKKTCFVEEILSI
jgi:hypothetical protein